MFRKITSLLLVLIMTASFIPIQISAYNDEYEIGDDELVESSEAPGMMISSNSVQLMSASGNGKYQISVGTYLYVRSEPSSNSSVVGSLNNGDQVWIVETSGNWGRFDGGWISLNYANLIDTDNEKPSISNIRIAAIDNGGYNIVCDVSDNNSGVSYVKFPTWTTGDQSDIIWEDSALNGNTADCRINISSYNYKYGYYITHIYAYDYAGNYNSIAVGFHYNKQEANKYCYITYKDTDKVLGINGTNVELQTKNNSMGQIWKIENRGDGSYKITNGENGQVLDVYGASGNAGTNVETYKSIDSSAQKWYFYYGPDGEYRLRAACTSCVLDVAGGYDTEGTNIQTWQVNNSKAQKFGLEAVSISDYAVNLDSLKYENNVLNISGWGIEMDGNNNMPITYQIDDDEEVALERRDASDVHNVYTAYPEGNERFDCSIPAYKMENGKHNVILRAYVAGQYEIKLGELSFESQAVTKPVIKETNSSNGKTVTITTETNGADIYYTMDGSDPSDSTTRQKYSGAISFDKMGVYTIKAVGEKDGYGVSETVTSDITLSKVAVPEVSSTNSKAVITGSGTLYYTTNGTAPTTNSTVYTSPFNITNGMIINTMAVQSGSEISETATYYTVVYNLMGGSGTIYPQVIKKNTTAAIRNLIPKKDGYTFKGWSLSSSAKTVDYKQGESLFANKSLSLYAVWEANTYTITYDFNGGVGDTKSQIKTYGEDLKLSEVSPMKDNYTFKGWSTEKNSDRVDYNSGDWYRANETVTLYAVWEKKTFTVHFDANGGDNAPDEQYKVVEEPLILTDEIPTRPGYRFKGWTVSSGTDNVFFEAGATYTFDSNITLYAVWTPGEYNITFITNDGKINSGNVDTYIYLSGAALPTDVTRDGYVFEGWYDNPEFAGKKIEQIEVSEYGEKTYYAKWSINSSVTVVYNAAYNGGEQENRTVTMATGSDVDLSVPATKDGWTFVGWNTNPNETKALSSYKATGYTTLYAIFSKTITASFYSANNRLQGTKTVIIYNKAEKGSITAPAVYPYNSWDVLGWRNDTFPLPSMYNEGSSIIIEADTDYYAVYSRTLTLSYNSSGGSTTPKSEIFNQICSASGNRESKEFRLSVGPTRDGYTFDKWAKSSLDGETYNEGEPISIDNDTMMYAIWKESSSPSTPTPTPKPDEPVVDPAKKPSVTISSVSANGNNITVSGKINNPGNWNMRGVSCVLNCSVGHYEAVQECAIKTDYSFSETLRWTNDNIGMATVQATISFDYADTSYTIKSNSDECMVGNSKKKYIELSPKALSLSVGEKTVLLVSTNSQISGYNNNIVWKSDNENAVSVSNDGEITALKAGRANVKATVMQKGKTVASTSAEVVVSNNYISNSFDFSEWNMYKSTGTSNRKNGWDVNDGNAMKALAYLTRWNGVINEADDRYNGADGRIDISGKYHVQEAIFISPKESQIENQKISDNAAYIRDMKSMLMTYGGIYSSVYYDNDYFADEEHSYYFCPEKTKNGQNLKNNHAIAIVGWDDSISKSKFTNHGINPRDNGAFICKNSYGDNQNDNGYFYISYDDVFLGTNASTVFNNVEAFSSSGYNKIYQYDYLGATAAITLNDNDKSVYCASVFTNNTSESETLKAVSTYAYNESERYNVYIIKNIGASEEDKKNALKNGITTDNLKAGGSLQYKGYYTIDLDEDVTIEPNETFAVVIKLINNQNAYFYMESKGNSNYYSNATANDGESFVSRDGMEWYDCNSEIKGYEGSNVCVKAFSKTNGGDISIMSVVEDDAPFKLFGAIEVSDSGGLESDILVGKSSVDGKMEDYKFPAVYDLRTLGFVTSVKDQAPYSSCWAFATYASLESCLMKKSAMIDKSRILEGASEGEYINLATQEIPVTGISIDELSKSYAQIIPVGYQRNVSASITPFNASDSSVKWHSDDDAVASVDEHGVISGLKVGTTTITAETGDGKYSDSFVVTVREPTTDIYSVELSDENIIVKNNQKFTIDYIVRPLNAVDYDIDIISKNPDVVTVDENGILQAASLGIAEVELTATGADREHYSTICTVNVDDSMELNISCNSHSLGVYSNMTFGGINLDVNNKTDDKVSVSIYIAFYDANGTLLGVKKYEETFNSGSNVTEYNNLTMEGKTKSVKVFAWNEDLKPCSAPEIIELNTTS